jgi:hypothetical protein
MVKQASRMVPLIGGEPSLLDRGFEFDIDKWQTLRTSALELAHIDVLGPEQRKVALPMIQNVSVAASALAPAVAQVDVSKLREQIETIRDGLSGLFSGPAGSLPLSSIAVELGITASGDVGFIVAKASVELSGKITVTFAHPG